MNNNESCFRYKGKKYARPSLWIIECAQCNQKLSLGLDLYFIKLLGLTKIHLHCRKTNVILDCTEGSLVDIVKKLSRELDSKNQTRKNNISQTICIKDFSMFYVNQCLLKPNKFTSYMYTPSWNHQIN